MNARHQKQNTRAYGDVRRARDTVINADISDKRGDERDDYVLKFQIYLKFRQDKAQVKADQRSYKNAAHRADIALK